MAKTAKGKSQEGLISEEADQTTETPRTPPTSDEIAVRAYHIYLERGGGDGDPLDDWLQAERELTQAEN